MLLLKIYSLRPPLKVGSAVLSNIYELRHTKFHLLHSECDFRRKIYDNFSHMFLNRFLRPRDVTIA